MPAVSAAQLPNLFLIGAAKSGTTSLHNYLDAHPEISMTRPKEPGFFATAAWRQRLPRYAALFSSPDAPVRGESSTLYTYHPIAQGIPERIASQCPDARLIYVVRDPIDRVVAHWVEDYAALREHRTLAGVLVDLDQPANRYVAPSRYATQLEQWLPWYEDNRLLIIDQEDLRHHRERVVLEALRFLEVDPEVPADLTFEMNVSGAKGSMTPAAARLWFILQPATRRLPGDLKKTLARSRLFPTRRIGKPALDDATRSALAAELGGEAARFRELTGMSFPTWTI